MERALIGPLDLIEGVARLVQLAMRLGEALVRRALARYDTSVDDDEAKLISQGWAAAAGEGATAASQGLADQERRVVSMIVLRRDEKVVLHMTKNDRRCKTVFKGYKVASLSFRVTSACFAIRYVALLCCALLRFGVLCFALLYLHFFT